MHRASALLLMALLAGCGREPAQHQQQSDVSGDAAVEQLADRTYDVWLRLYVDDRLRAGVPTGAPDLSEAGLQAMRRDAEAILQDSSTIQASSLGEDARLTYGLIREAAEVARDAAAFFDIHFALVPNQSSFHFLAYVDEIGKQRVADAAGREAYFTLVDYYGDLAHQHLQRLEQQQARGARMSKYLVERTVRMLASLRKSLRTDLAVDRAIAEVPAEERAAFTKQIEAKLAGDIEPAFDALLKFLDGTYRREAPDAIGLSQYPKGKQYYAYLIRRNSSLPMSARDIHELGKKRVQELQTDIMASAPALGYRGDNLRAFFDHLKADRRFTAGSVADWEREYAADLAAVQPLLSNVFASLPATPFRLQAMRDSEQGLAHGYYSAPTPTQPEGIFYFSGSDPSGPSLLGTRALAYHETVPGHHLQMARVGEMKGLDKLQSIYWVGGYTEGWAEYGVDLAKELGAFDDPYELLGYRMWRLLMAARLMADTGINEDGWTLDEARRFWHDNTYLSEQQIDSEIQRSAAIPGQLLVYRLGYEKMLELRQRAEQTLGARFDPKVYHEWLLQDGALPLTVLEQKVTEHLQ